MKEFLFGLTITVITIMALRFAGRLIVKHLYVPLDNFCIERGFSTSSWGWWIWTLILVSELVNRTAYSLFFQYWIYTRWITPERFPWVMAGLIALPYLFLLIKMRVIYFIPVLLAKILGAPMMVIAFLSGYKGGPIIDDSDGEYVPMPGIYRDGPPSSNSFKMHNRYSPADTYQQQNSGDSTPTDMPNFMADKYGDQYRESQGGDGYSTTEVGGQTAYYRGDYAPFGSDGEHREYDSNYSPMD